MNTLVKLIISTLAVLITAYLLPGVYVDSFTTAIVVACVLGVLNVFVKPLLILVTLPAVVFSFGLFLIVINILIILLASKLIDGFHVKSVGWAFLFSIVNWMVSSILNKIKQRDEQAE